MNCVSCADKKCRSLQACDVIGFGKEELINEYELPRNQNILQSAALPADKGRAGSPSRLDEIIEFIIAAGYKKPGLAYCYGMENDALKALKEVRRAAVSGLAILEWDYKMEELGLPFEHRLKPERIESLAKEAGFSSFEVHKLKTLVLYKLS